jgi:hypothetical protein
LHCSPWTVPPDTRCKESARPATPTVVVSSLDAERIEKLKEVTYQPERIGAYHR